MTRTHRILSKKPTFAHFGEGRRFISHYMIDRAGRVGVAPVRYRGPSLVPAVAMPHK